MATDDIDRLKRLTPAEVEATYDALIMALGPRWRYLVGRDALPLSGREVFERVASSGFAEKVMPLTAARSTGNPAAANGQRIGLILYATVKFNTYPTTRLFDPSNPGGRGGARGRGQSSAWALFSSALRELKMAGVLSIIDQAPTWPFLLKALDDIVYPDAQTAAANEAIAALAQAARAVREVRNWHGMEATARAQVEAIERHLG